MGLILYVSAVAFAHLPDRLILFPTTERVDTNGATRRAIPFQKGELEIWIATSRLAQRSQPQIYVLRFYGNGDRADRWVASEADSFGERAVNVWGVNYPGYGGSTGPARLAAIGPAALAAYDALKTVAGEKPIVVFGASLGTTAALHVAAKRPVAGVILHNPPALRQMIMEKFGWWNLWLLAAPVAAQIPSDLDSIANAKASRAPAIFLLAENDTIVPPKYHHRVADAYAGEKRVIILKGADHNSPIEGDGLAAYHRALDWLGSSARFQLAIP